jgi:hypothetical protein
VSKRWLALSLALVCALAGQALAQPAPEPEATGDAQNPPAATEQPAEEGSEAAAPPAPAIVLARNLRLVIRPTLLGLVPPEDAEGYGQAFIRITDATPAGLSLHYEIKELVDSAGGQASEWWQAPPEKAEPLTRIRRGEVTVAGLADARAMLSPLLWPDGGFATQSSLLWLSQECYRELAGGGAAQFDGHCAAEAPAALAALQASLLAERRGQAGLAESDPLRLELVRRAGYPCQVNGVRLRLPALLARDSAGLAEYWILDDEANPLVLKLSYLPGANVDAAPAEGPAPASPAGPDPRRPKLKIGGSVYTAPGQALAQPPAEAGAGGLESLVNEGGGYAVTTIDF